ncbi:MAG TPA: class I SAM-dependent methyltransferase [Solirubrobacterales bacterium]|nr:class I SAM-dependent methyltransferase [Solirubrobacterales bacterium]
METSTTPSSGDSRHAEAAYEAIAPVYDDFTAHHNYRLWITTLLELGAAHGLQGDTVLDVACGTGKSFIPMLEHGWKVTACDISASMVEMARAKAGPEVRLDVADMRKLPVYGSFDLVCCLDDAVNYLHTQAELEQTLRGLVANMAPHALCIFDSNTITQFRGFFAEQFEMEMNGRRMIWEGHVDDSFAPGDIAEASFSFEAIESGAGPTVPPELHRQRHHPEAEVRAAIDGAGLELIATYGHHHDGVPHQPMSEEDHTKAIYIARLAKRGGEEGDPSLTNCGEVRSGSRSSPSIPRRPRS